MVIFGEDGQVEIRRELLVPPWQGVYDQGVIYVDLSVPQWGVDEIVNQLQHKLIGNDHLAPNVEPYRPRHLYLAHSADTPTTTDRDPNEGRETG